MTFKITCRDCKKPFKSSSKSRLICDPCKQIIKKAYYHEHKHSLRLATKRNKEAATTIKPRPVLITEAEQNAINRRVDNMYVSVDPGRIIPRNSPEFHDIARHLIRRECGARILCR